jgi:ribosomal protein S18 acetylase RimI-like enzyme
LLAFCDVPLACFQLEGRASENFGILDTPFPVYPWLEMRRIEARCRVDEQISCAAPIVVLKEPTMPITVQTIARATPVDIEPLVSLMHDFYAESGHALDAAWAGHAFRQLLGDASLGAVWIARVGAMAVGHAVLTTRYTMEHGAPGGYVDDLYVNPKFRRGGFASAMLVALFAECAARQCQAVYVEVGDDNAAARALYSRFGLRAAQDGRILMSGPVPAAQ